LIAGSAGLELAVRIFQSVSSLCYAKHDFGPRLHCFGGADLRQVAAGATLLACLLFGFTEAVSIQMQGAIKPAAFFGDLAAADPG